MEEVTFTLRYHKRVVRGDIPSLPRMERAQIQRAIEQKLTTHPDLFGKPLRRSLIGARSLRVGDYRVIFRIQRTTVHIDIIAHRSVVYERAGKRIP